MQTRGEYRVKARRSELDEATKAAVDEIQTLAAALIDRIDAIPDGSHRGGAQAEVCRLKALAATAVEEASMWAVKAATKPEPGETGQ